MLPSILQVLRTELRLDETEKARIGLESELGAAKTNGGGNRRPDQRATQPDAGDDSGMSSDEEDLENTALDRRRMELPGRDRRESWIAIPTSRPMASSLRRPQLNCCHLDSRMQHATDIR